MKIRFFLPGTVLTLFILFVILLAAQPDAPIDSSQSRNWHGIVSAGLALSLSLLVAAFAAWFLYCFTGEPDGKVDDSFMLAYAFTFISFFLLVAPIFGLVKSSDEQGFLSFMRGCAQPKSDISNSYAPALLCSTEKAEDGDPSAAPNFHSQWLVAIGGVNGRKVEDKQLVGSEPYIVVTDGLIVPLYVVILAFVGGAVSLSRRIPEYQKRAAKGYVSTAEEPGLKPFAAREYVVFQIMQLVSAPFIAITAFYVVAPASISVTAGLAFASGFASEPILLIIRGMVNGIKPVSVLMPKPANDGSITVISGTVLSQAGAAVDGAAVSIDGTTITTTSDAQGRFLLPQVPVGKQKVVAAKGAAKGDSSIVVLAQNNPEVTITIV